MHPPSRASPDTVSSSPKMSSAPVLHRLGKDGPMIPAIGFGLMGLSSHSYGPPPDDEERFALLDRAYELGARFWDSAEYDSLPWLQLVAWTYITLYLIVSMATTKSCWASGSRKLENVMTFFSLRNSASSRVDKHTKLTALPSTARRLVLRA